MADLTVEALEHYRVPQPAFQTAQGQGDPPTGVTITHDDASITIPWDTTVQASAHVDKPGNMVDYTPGKVHKDVLQDLADTGQLKHVPTE